MPFLSLQGRRLHYEDQGRGPALALLPGLGMDSRGWRAAAPILGRGRRLICWDPPGCGRGGPAPEGLSIAGLADMFAELAGALGLERLSVVGLSMGGMVALEAAARPGLVDKLVVSNLGARLPAALRSKLLLWGRMRQEGVNPELRILDQMLWTIPPEYFENQALLESLTAQALGDPWAQSDRDYQRQLAAVLDYDLPGAPGRVSCPALVLAAADDLMTPPGYCRDLASLLPRGRFHLLPGGGHQPHLFQAAAWARAVDSFLRE